MQEHIWKKKVTEKIYTCNGTSCSDVDECVVNSACHKYATCNNTIGSYTCTCNSGYQGNGTFCSDVNECLTSPCHKNATCANTDGSYTCTCNPGFQGNGTFCSDINECLTSPCHINATCNNTIGSYTCTCNSGYQGNGTFCSDVNECLTSPCHKNASCANTDGSYTCTCNTGFQGNGTSCSDVDECLSRPCHINATCSNTVGSYTCTCNTGFQGNGTSCIDIDECLKSPCHKDATCTNSIGSYSCTCNSGYQGNGIICCAITCDPLNYCFNGGTCTRTGSDCVQICTCVPGYEGTRCTSSSSIFLPVPVKDPPKRTVNLQLKSASNFSDVDADAKVKELVATLTLNLPSNNIQYTAFSNGIRRVTTAFNYTGNLTVINFLNDKLFNELQGRVVSTRAARAASDQNISLNSITDGNKTSKDDLVQYFKCGDFPQTAYTLNPSTFTCESKCNNYCNNSGVCNLTADGPICSCVPFSIYSTSGKTCDTITMNLNAFFGILFGALAFLFLLMIAIFLTVYWCRKRRPEVDDESYSYINPSTYNKSLSGFKRFQETEVPKYEPNLISWKPRLDNVDTSFKAKIGRPQILNESSSNNSEHSSEQ
ncbi:uncharacterized protein LOC144792127 [Lissotriton helveticus]